MQKIVIVGGDSYLATGLNKYLSGYSVSYLYYNNWKNNISILRDADYVINFSISPEFSTQDILEENVIDIQIAETIKDAKTKFIFMSSRKVYGSSNNLTRYKETDKLCGIDFYAKNKIKIENRLKKILENKLTILRISNVIGEPIHRQGYKTFVGWMCESYINQGYLVATKNTKAQKDFITKDFLQKCIATLIKKNKTGIYNVSAGFSMKISDIINGYIGEDNVKYLGDNEPLLDQFILDNTKLLNIINTPLTFENIQKYLNDCKKKLLSFKN